MEGKTEEVRRRGQRRGTSLLKRRLDKEEREMTTRREYKSTATTVLAGRIFIKKKKEKIEKGNKKADKSIKGESGENEGKLPGGRYKTVRP